MKNEKGFTVIELVIFFVILVVLAVFFVLQRFDLEASFADAERKTAINAMYYSLVEVYQPEHGYYPSEISEETFKAVDPDLLYDASDIFVGDNDGDYHYEGLDCNGNGECKAFRLSADLEKEENYVLDSQEEN